MAFLRSFPLFILVLVAYNVLMLLTDVTQSLNETVLTFGLVSGAMWTLTASDLLIIFGVLVLYIEIFKSTRTNMASVLDHSLSTIVFIIFLVEFLLVQGAGTSTFFVLTLMSILDVIAGFTVTIAGARRDIGFGHVNE